MMLGWERKRFAFSGGGQVVRYKVLVVVALMAEFESYTAVAAPCFKENQSVTLDGKLASRQATSVHDDKTFE
jgi:hypothetical protein